MGVDGATTMIIPSSIDKPSDPGRHHLESYDASCASFSWVDALASLDGLPGAGGLNIAYEAVDRHGFGARAEHTALRILPRRGESRSVSYRELALLTNRFANALTSLGIVPGECIVVVAGRGLTMYTTVLGCLKHRVVVCPVFSAFGPEPIRQRLELSDAVAVVTTPELYERKIAGIRDGLPRLRHALVAGGRAPEGTVDLDAAITAASDQYSIAPTDPETPSLLHFTSGTTGAPKGALHVHGAIVSHVVTARLALDLHDDDVFWCTADPGWVTGTSYGIIAPLACGVTAVVDEAEFDAERWYRILDEQRVTVWYTAPTAVRMLMKAGTEALGGRTLPALRFAASVGEPLGPDAVMWGQQVLGHPFHDNWWQTETGGIMISNYAAMPIRPGSMGKPLPGIEAALLRCADDGELERDSDGHAIVIHEADVEGMLALRPGWPSMFRSYLHNPERYAKCFVDGWYISGDLSRRDADGYYWFVSRADDVIKTAGHLIGPFEVETVLRESPAVADAGVYGVPDPVAGNVIHAAVVLRPGLESHNVERDLMAHARRKLGAALAPRSFVFVTELPRTRSGKILRRLLRARELGLPEGDTSTLEGAPTLEGGSS
jgi:acetyl-CoA synthetase